jgi:hypothetical protein
MENKTTVNSESRKNLEIFVPQFVVLTRNLHAGTAENHEKLALLRK